MQVTIETINGRDYTVIRHDGGEVCFWLSSSHGLMGYGADYELYLPDGLIATALPPLPRRPKPEDMALYHAYASHGLDVVLSSTSKESGATEQFYFMGHYEDFLHCVYDSEDIKAEYDDEITGAVHSGNQVDVAITD